MVYSFEEPHAKAQRKEMKKSFLVPTLEHGNQATLRLCVRLFFFKKP